MQKMLTTDSWLIFSYHSVIYFHLNTLMMKLTRAIILRIKDRSNYQIKGKIIKLTSNKRKGRTKYYFKNHKRQGIGNIKPKKHATPKTTKVNSLNTIVYNSSINKKNNKEYWEQESYPIAIDSCCSVSIVKYKQDFLGTLQEFNVTIQCFNGSSEIKQKGTCKFKIEDNNCTMHDILIPNTLLAPEAPYHLLSPQHWGQQSRDPDGIYCMIKHNKMVLYREGGNS